MILITSPSKRHNKQLITFRNNHGYFASFQNLRIAQAFSDHLNTLHIDNKIEFDEFNYLLITTEVNQQQAQHELMLFLENPSADKYLSASWKTGTTKQHSSQFLYENSHLLTNFVAHAGILTHSIFCVVRYCLSLKFNRFNTTRLFSAFFFYANNLLIQPKVGVLLPLFFYTLVRCILFLIYFGGGSWQALLKNNKEKADY